MQILNATLCNSKFDLCFKDWFQNMMCLHSNIMVVSRRKLKLYYEVKDAIYHVNTLKLRLRQYRNTCNKSNIFVPKNQVIQPHFVTMSVDSEAVVDGVYKLRIFIQCSCLIASLRCYMNQHYEEPGCSFLCQEMR